MAEKALELSALALAVRVMGRTSLDSFDASRLRRNAPSAQDDTVQPFEKLGVRNEVPASETTALEFLKETGDEHTRLYRASDGEGELLAAFYSDGRLRIADERFRFSGIVQSGHAHLLQIGGGAWSEVFVLVTPEGRLQLDLRDGPYDGRVLTCEALA